jgi:mono/diheme cytochrome c family protein
MQVKIVIGTVALMLTMVILGFAALREPARLEEYTEARIGRQIEAGASLYQSQCATCHGVNGNSEVCYDAGTGEQIGCVGLPLNYAPLLCGDTSERMEIMNWEGSKEAFISATIASGRYGTEMPTWAQEYGGPLRPDQVEDLTVFVLNWQTEELCSAPPEPAYDWPESVEDFLAAEEIEEGDPAQGFELYQVTYGCAACHGDFSQPEWDGTGPWVGETAELAPRDVEGATAEQYVYESILNPSAYVVDGYPEGAMPANFALRMGDNPQHMADILAYIFGGGEGQ